MSDARQLRRRAKLRYAPAALLRRSLQFGVLLFIAYCALGGIWRNYKVAHNSSRLVGLMHGDRWAEAYAGNEAMLKLWGEPYAASLDFLGMPWAATVFGVQTADPILVLSTMLSSRTLIPGLVLSGMVAVVLAIVLGKVFCSHLCPMRLLFEFGQLIRGGLLWLGAPLPHLRSEVRLGGWVLLGGLLASLSVGLSVWFVLLPYLSVAAAIFMGITAATSAGLLIVPGALWVFDLLFAPGMFCRNLCPQGALLEQLGRFSLLRLVKDPARPCPTPCRACSMTCPYGLSPRDQTHRPMCDNCGRCIPRCPTAVLSRRVHLPILRAGAGAGAGAGTGAAAAALAFALLVPLTAAAHHNKGLPHYGYFENYPQVPTDEVIAIDERWEIGATIFNFQGYERKDADTPNDVKFFVYLYDLEANEAYIGPVTFDIVLDGEVVSTFTRESVDEEVVYSTRETLPETGDYELVAHIPGSDIHPVVEFYVDLDEGGVSWGLVLGLTLPLLPLLGLVLVGRSRKGRSELMRDRPVSEAS